MVLHQVSVCSDTLSQTHTAMASHDVRRMEENAMAEMKPKFLYKISTQQNALQVLSRLNYQLLVVASFRSLPRLWHHDQPLELPQILLMEAVVPRIDYGLSLFVQNWQLLWHPKPFPKRIANDHLQNPKNYIRFRRNPLYQGKR